MKFHFICNILLSRTGMSLFQQIPIFLPSVSISTVLIGKLTICSVFADDVLHKSRVDGEGIKGQRLSQLAYNLLQMFLGFFNLFWWPFQFDFVAALCKFNVNLKKKERRDTDC